jgi:hypothetical protein
MLIKAGCRDEQENIDAEQGRKGLHGPAKIYKTVELFISKEPLDRIDHQLILYRIPECKG